MAQDTELEFAEGLAQELADGERVPMLLVDRVMLRQSVNWYTAQVVALSHVRAAVAVLERDSARDDSNLTRLREMEDQLASTVVEKERSINRLGVAAFGHHTARRRKKGMDSASHDVLLVPNEEAGE
jgi:hypothetical protein